MQSGLRRHFAASQYLEAMRLLRDGEADFVYPFVRPILGIPANTQIEALEILKTRPLGEVETERLTKCVSRALSVGGAVFGVTQIYRACGGENEKFIGWGCENLERVIRFRKLGHRVARAPGCFYHMSHPRGTTSCKKHKHFNANQRQYKIVKTLPRKLLEIKIAMWKWER